ncbi:MAG: shikimate kinase [Spirulinaceae cyanobacterium RM2_2_10]|nr:shikimate kinase [Spirulinaceae cyanobacterium SM2_1_0]NJO21489.1 shikimate kinase [Spirulinaceae cyanobacterium RM2_2_10]
MSDPQPLNLDLEGITIYLIGMMGAGKSTVGRALAKQLEYRFFDSDDLIEKVSQQAIADLFAHQGEAAFRDLETQVLQQLAACARSVIATGGGIVLRQQNWSYLQEGLVIWLDAPVDILVSRLRDDTSRPLLQAADLTAKLTALFTERRSRYAQADLKISVTAEQTPAAIAQTILTQIPSILKAPLVPIEVEQN